MNPLRDALATALWDSPNSTENGGPAQLMRDKADYVLSAPIFRAALVDTLARALHADDADETLPFGDAYCYCPAAAEAYVGRMLGETT